MYHNKPKTILKRYNGFKPLRELDIEDVSFPACLNMFGVSRHIQEHRQSRFNAMEVNAGIGNSVARFLVSRNNKEEIHTLFDNGVIITQTPPSKTVVTFMFARPEQIKEYWIGMGCSFPNEIDYLLEIADENQYLAWHD